MSLRKTSAHPSSEPRPRITRILLALTYLCALSLLILWEYHERLDVFSSDCDLRDQPKSALYNRAYAWMFDWARPEAPAQVVALAITADLEEVQSNLCLSRAYLADVLQVLARDRPAVVVIDKFYSPNACVTDPASTRNLAAQVRAFPAPVVLGESSDGIEHAQANACLVRRPQLDFHAPNVSHGLTRISVDPERLPLRWPILPRGAEPSAQSSTAPPAPMQPESADSLSLAAVRAYDPEFAARPRIQHLLGDQDHAYADAGLPVPRVTSSQILCSARDVDGNALRSRWHPNCEATAQLPALLGKIVLIGAESAADRKHVLQGDVWGFELQARYIQSLLSGDYLRSPPIALSIALFAFFVFIIEGVPILLLGYRPKWKRKALLRFAYPRRRYVWVIFWAIFVLAAGTVLSLALRFLPPLLLYGDILLVAMTRLMYFAAESAEHPFLHAHHHRKAHAMSIPHTSGSIPPAEPSFEETPTELSAQTEAQPPRITLAKEQPASEAGTPGQS